MQALVREQQREIAVVISAAGKAFAAAIDAVEAVEKISSASMGPLPLALALGQRGIVSATARRSKSNDLVLIIEAQRLISRGDLDRAQASSRPPGRSG
jgi:chemotaxis signal transduction protein